MISAKERTRRELVALVAMINAVRQITSPKEKGRFLTIHLGDHPELIKYWRDAYDPAAEFKNEHKIVPLEMVGRAIKMLQAKDFKCGVSIRLFNKVLGKLGKSKIVIPEREDSEIGFCIRIDSIGRDHATGVLVFNGKRMANASFVMGKPLFEGFKELKKQGIKFDIPKYIDFPKF